MKLNQSIKLTAVILVLAIFVVGCNNVNNESADSVKSSSVDSAISTQVRNLVGAIFNRHQATRANKLNESILATVGTIDLSLSVQDSDNVAQNDTEVEAYGSASDGTTRFKYMYAASGNKIEMFRVESGGGLHGLGAVSSGITGAAISSLAVTATNQFVYATIENGTNDDRIFMLRIDHSTGALTPLTESMLSTGKTGTSSIITSKDSKFAYVANSTEICSYAIESRSGILSRTPSPCISPTTKDKNNKDVVQPYAQLALSPNGKYILVSSGPSLNTIITLKRDPNGGLSYLSQLNTGVNYNLSMAIPAITGRFIYTALKGNGAVGQYSLESSSGIVKPLTPQTITTGSSDAEPHAVAITLNQKYAYAANYHKNTIAQFKIDTAGKLQSLGTAINASGGPDKIIINPGYVYVATADKHILQYQINHDTGLLTPLPTSSISVNESISQMVMASIISSNKYVVQTSPHVVYESEVATLVFDESHVNMASVTEDNIKLCELESQSANEYTTQDSSSCIVHDVTLLWVAYNTVKVISNDPLGASKYLNLIISDVKDIFGGIEDTTTFNEVTSGTAEYTMLVPPAPYTDVSPYIENIVVQFNDPIEPVTIDHVRVTKQSTLNCCPIEGEMHIESEGDDCVACPVEELPVDAVEAIAAPNGVVYAVNVHLAVAPMGLGVHVIAHIKYSNVGSPIIHDAQPSFITFEESITLRKMKIYKASNMRRGYPANIGLDGFDAACNSDLEKPVERDGSSSYYSALVGSRRITGSSIVKEERYPFNTSGEYSPQTWVLEPNTPYYNSAGKLLAYTNDFAVFEATNNARFKSHIYPLALRRIDGNPNTLATWTGIEMTDWTVDSYNNCEQWSSLEYEATLGVNRNRSISDNFEFVGHLGKNKFSCGATQAIYCVQRW